jgi:hypothetical protein
MNVLIPFIGRSVPRTMMSRSEEPMTGPIICISRQPGSPSSDAPIELAGIGAARAAARARAWAAGAARERVILDFDATPIDVHSEKERAAGHYKGGFGFNPLLVSCGPEVLAGILRPGNAGANNVDDHLQLLDLALEQLPPNALDEENLARSGFGGSEP